MRPYFLAWILPACVLALLASDALGQQAPKAKRPLVAVIDFRQTELSRAFRRSLDAALVRLGAAADIEPRIAFVNAPLPRSSFAAEVRALEAQRPDIYYATTTDIARDIRSANAKVPIVFSGIVDPRDAGLITSIERPENNLTGFVSHEAIEDKRLELLAALRTGIRRIGLVLLEGSVAHASLTERLAFGDRAGLVLVPLVFGANDDAAALPSLIARHRLEALDVPSSQFTRRHHATIIQSAVRAGIPSSFRSADYVKLGGLLSYEPAEFDYPEKAAQLLTRILQGVAPADIPVEFPSEFILALNLTTAERLPFKLNKGILKRANRFYRDPASSGSGAR